MFTTVPENIQLMKFRISRKLKNIILSIIFEILTFSFIVCPNVLKMLGSVGTHLFLECHKNNGRQQKQGRSG